MKHFRPHCNAVCGQEQKMKNSYLSGEGVHTMPSLTPGVNVSSQLHRLPQMMDEETKAECG